MKILLIATNRHGRYMNDIQAQPLPISLAYIVGLHRWLTSLAYIVGLHRWLTSLAYIVGLHRWLTSLAYIVGLHRWLTSLAYIAGYLDREEHSTKMLDLMFADDYIGDVEKAVRDIQPDLVGLSIRNLDNDSNLDPQSVLPITKEVTEKI